MDKIKRFIDCYIPTETCNLRCHYCYIAQKRLFNNKLAKFNYPVEHIRKAFSKERLGGVCLLNMCAGGETLLSDELLPVVKALIEEGHYVFIVTNGTLDKRFKEIASWSSDIRSHLAIKFSFHYLEMIRLNMLDRFFGNVDLMKKSGVSFTVEITPNDELIPHIEEIKKVCMEKLGCLCHVTIARDDRTNGIDVLSEYDFDTYKKIWGQFNSDLFSFKSKIFYQKRKEFCYAGDWSIYVNMGSGVITQCYVGKKIGNIYDLSKPINFEAIGCNCTLPHCYNGHAFLTLGDIPELKTPNYAQVRNRVCADGSQWLTEDFKDFISNKLADNNKEYSSLKQYKINHKKYHGCGFRGYLSQFGFYQKLHDIKVKKKNV